METNSVTRNSFRYAGYIVFARRQRSRETTIKPTCIGSGDGRATPEPKAVLAEFTRYVLAVLAGVRERQKRLQSGHPRSISDAQLRLRAAAAYQSRPRCRSVSRASATPRVSPPDQLWDRREVPCVFLLSSCFALNHRPDRVVSSTPSKSRIVRET